MVSEQEQMDDAINKMYEEELKNSQKMQVAQQMPYAGAMFANQQKQNLVEWQLDFKTELEEIARLLRCDVLKVDGQGNENWVRNPDSDKIVFNEVGVGDIVREIRMFLNKNKVLSNYSLEEIKPRIRMIGHELRVLIYNNYEYYGLDNDYKINNYSMIVLTILSMIEDAFRRAINGEERRDLNQMRLVNQSDSTQPSGYYPPQMSIQPKKKVWNPFTWFK